MEVLFQLSYSPGKLKIYRKIQTCPLPFLRRLHPQLDRAPPDHELDREKVAAVELAAVHRDEVDLVRRCSAVRT